MQYSQKDIFLNSVDERLTMENRRMRILLLTLAMAFLSPATSSAITVGDLYKDCKSLADRSFKFEGIDDVGCFVYFSAVRDMASSICSDKTANESYRLQYGVGVVDGANAIQASIQHFVHSAANKPTEWQYKAAYDVLASLQAIGPCK